MKTYLVFSRVVHFFHHWYKCLLERPYHVWLHDKSHVILRFGNWIQYIRYKRLILGNTFVLFVKQNYKILQQSNWDHLLKIVKVDSWEVLTNFWMCVPGRRQTRRRCFTWIYRLVVCYRSGLKIFISFLFQLLKIQ